MITIITALWECGHHDCTLSSRQPSATCFSVTPIMCHGLGYALYRCYFGS